MSSRNSVASCAARVLLCASTSVGRCTCSISQRRGRRLAGAGGAEEHDVGLAGVDPAGQFGDRGGLVAARPVLAHDLERTDGSRGLHAFQSRFARRHSGRERESVTRAAAYARARSCLMRCQRASTWPMVWAIEPSVSITTSATASRCRVVDLGVDARLRLDRVESALLDEALDLGALGRARHDDEVERVVDGGLDQERNVVDHDGVGVLGLDLRHEPWRPARGPRDARWR